MLLEWLLFQASTWYCTTKYTNNPWGLIVFEIKFKKDRVYEKKTFKALGLRKCNVLRVLIPNTTVYFKTALEP